MLAALNDLSLKGTFQNKEEAIKKVRQWMNACRKIEEKETTAVERLCSVWINTSAEIAPNYPLIQLLKEFQTQDDRRYLIHLFANLDTPDQMPEIPFCIGDNDSAICAWAKDGILISLETDSAFRKETVDGYIGEEEVKIKNISNKEHIRLYESQLGIRHYEANKKHRKDPYIDAAGRYVDAMDLTDEEAQKLLSRAIEINENLYGKKGGQYYCFQRHHDNYYHGYQNNELGIHITKRIDEEDWD